MTREDLISEAAQAAADFGSAADAVDEAAATLFGVNRTDLRIIGLVHQVGALSAGELAKAAGLSPAATTTAVQRLAAAGHLTRSTDSNDRRRALVRLTPAAAELLETAYGPVARGGRRILSRYTTAELAVIADALRRGERMQRAETERIQGLVPADGDSARAAGGVSAPPGAAGRAAVRRSGRARPPAASGR